MTVGTVPAAAAIAPPDPARDRLISLSPVRIVLLIIAISLLLRLTGAALLGLGVDESYAIAVSRVPSLSFFDHPPLGFLLGRWAADLSGSEAGLIVRAPYLLLSSGSIWLLYALSAKLFTPRAGTWAAAWFAVAPFFLVSAGSWIVPDGPLTFFLLIAAYLVCRIFFDEKPARVWSMWLAAGAAFGLALLSKYQATLVGFGALVFLLSNRHARDWLCHPAPYLAGLVAIGFFIPVIVWSAQHDWHSFSFQIGRAVGGGTFSLSDRGFNVVRMVLGQMVYAGPFVFILSVGVLWSGLRNGPADERRWLCAMLALPTILLFNMIAPFTGRSLPHWPMAGFLFVFPLLGDWIDRRSADGMRLVRRCFAASSAVLLLLIGSGLTHVRHGNLTSILTGKPPAWDNSIMASDWQELRVALDKDGWLDNEDVVIGARNWWQAAKIDYALGGRLPVFVFGRDKRHFTFLHSDHSASKGRALILELVKPRRRARKDNAVWQLAGVHYCRRDDHAPISLRLGQKHYRFLSVTEASRC